MKNISVSILFVWAALGPLGTVLPCVAGTIVTTHVQGIGSGDIGWFTDDGSGSAGILKSFNYLIEHDGVVRGTYAGNARAQIGSLGVDGYVTVDTDSAYGGAADVSSLAEFGDTLTITSPGLSGTVGTIAFNVSIDGLFLGSFGVHSRYYARYDYSLGSGDITYRTSEYRTEYQTAPIIVSTEMSTPFDFTYGRPFRIDASFSLVIDAEDSLGFSFASMSLLNSADLRGIGMVTDGQGNPVTEYTVSAESGADYTQPFGAISGPEPSSLLMAACGACVILLLRKLHGRDHRPLRGVRIQ